jgi:hypothetical protein
MNRALFKVNENIEAGDIVLLYEDTETLVADFLTKAVHGTRYKTFRARIMGDKNEEKTLILDGGSEKISHSLQLLNHGVNLKKIKIYFLEAE